MYIINMNINKIFINININKVLLHFLINIWKIFRGLANF